MKQGFLFGLLSLVLTSTVAVADEVAQPSADDATDKLQCKTGEECFNIGNEFYSGDNPKQSIGYFERACSMDMGRACAAMGVILIEGQLLAMDEQKASTYFEKGCKLNSGVACHNLAIYYSTLEVDDVRKAENAKRAMELLTQACDLNYSESCVELAERQSQLGNKAAAKVTLEKNCKTDTLYGCFALGNYYRVEENDYTRAIELWKSSCRNGFARSCEVLGLVYLGVDDATSVAVDLEQGNNYLEQACNGYLGSSCNYMGYSFEHGTFNPLNKEKAMAYYLKACDLNYGLGCSNLGNFYVVDNDFAKAMEMFEKSCSLDIAIGCYRLALTYDNENNPKFDRNKTNELYAKACAMGEAMACGNLGINYYFGNGVEKDAGKVSEYLSRGCELGNSLSCTRLGQYYSELADETKSVEYFRKGCDMQHGEACFLLSDLAEKGKLKPSATEKQRSSLDYLKLSCDLEYALGCAQTGLYLHSKAKKKNPLRAAAYWERGCDLGNAQSCSELGELYFKGDAVAQDPVLTIKYLQRGCHGGSSEGCAKLADFYDKVYKNQVLSLRYYNMACDGGDKESCKKVK